MAQLGYNNMIVHRHRNPALRGLHANARCACRRSSFRTTAAPCLPFTSTPPPQYPVSFNPRFSTCTPYSCSFLPPRLTFHTAFSSMFSTFRCSWAPCYILCKLPHLAADRAQQAGGAARGARHSRAPMLRRYAMTSASALSLLRAHLSAVMPRLQGR